MSLENAAKGVVVAEVGAGGAQRRIESGEVNNRARAPVPR
jgi:hypothetical protein